LENYDETVSGRFLSQFGKGMKAMPLEDVPVTIVGGGPVGLSMALALSRRGIASRVLELKSTTTDHPKARGVWVRAMEIFRQWGVYEPIRARGLPDDSHSMVFMDGLEKELGRSAPEPFNDESPARKSIVAQDAVEEALVAKLQDHPDADICWLTEFVGAEELVSGVRITARNLQTGKELSWLSTYLIGADGGTRVVAKIAGIEHEGPPVMAVLSNVYFKADLSAYKSVHNAAGLYFVPIDPTDAVLGLLNTNGADRWLWVSRIGAETDERERPLTQEETVSKLRKMMRKPDLPIQIINEGIWRMTRRIAKTFSKGRFFLVGDAAHRFPPHGGFGMNSGIQDVHNLAWKIAFALRGIASKALLDSYDIERRPIAHANADMAMINLGRFPRVLEAASSGDTDRLRFWLLDAANHTNSVGHTLGFVYDAGALVPDGTTRPPYSPRYYYPTDRPGSRFPHFWLDAAQTQSSIDLFDRDLVLVHGPEAHAWGSAAAEVSQRLSIPIVVHRLAAPDPKQGLAIGARGAVLVRPDGIVAWRIGWVTAYPADDLTNVIERVLNPNQTG
jgi:2-polyprenyl-6-methoxyphenol hydroxylase-like FAD-dependent oxidoreductase